MYSFQKAGGDQRTNCYCSLLTCCVGNWWATTYSVFQKMCCQNIHKGLLGSGRRAGVNLRGCSSTETWKVIYLALNIRKFFYLLVLKQTASKFLKIVVYFSKLQHSLVFFPVVRGRHCIHSLFQDSFGLIMTQFC